MSDATVNATAAAAAEASDSVAAGAPLISLDHVTVEFGRGKNRFRAVDDVSLTINKGSIYGIIGFSGAGKSTLVRTMNVLQRPTSGTVTFNGTTISTLGEGRLLPLRRKIAMIFQHFNLMPSRTVLDNVTLPLIHEKVSRKDARAKAMHLLELVGIADKAKAYPRQLSGGQQQRVAIARTLAPSPKVLFMDEPLSNLDAKLRQEMRTELKRLHSDTNSTFVYVTHDQLEAMTLSTKVCLMDTGVLQQYAPPLEIYGHPANLFVAEFVGNPTMNFIPATVKAADGNRASLSLLGHDATFTAKAPLGELTGSAVLGVRPEFLPIVQGGPLRGKTYSTLPAGMETTVKLSCGGTMLTSVVFGCVDYAVDTELPLNIVGDNIALFDQASGQSVGFGSVTF